jgi:hypothetical protein
MSLAITIVELVDHLCLHTAKHADMTCGAAMGENSNATAFYLFTSLRTFEEVLLLLHSLTSTPHESRPTKWSEPGNIQLQSCIAETGQMARMARIAH